MNMSGHYYYSGVSILDYLSAKISKTWTSKTWILTLSQNHFTLMFQWSPKRIINYPFGHVLKQPPSKVPGDTVYTLSPGSGIYTTIFTIERLHSLNLE